ncbi:17370_t:CDS:2 [Cetraspora pellucida]|uniref:17370_t:CDS:1 n=1 Tax=Cetraspora pellucida TaxID=1433469 RepID=A0ACA9N5U2_9GLOM|nr:17370_t:CDS:2 [Cetraspora pellucida]
MRLKEEWELARKNLINRESLMLENIAAASLTQQIKIALQKFFKVIKIDGKEGSHELINIEDKELKDLKTERHENYINFLTRINYLIKLEKRIGVWFAILMSLLVVVLAIITIFVSVSPVDIHFPNLTPIALFYLLMKRIYVVTGNVNEIYFGKFRTENDDVTFFGTEIDAKPILKLAMILDKEVCKTYKKGDEHDETHGGEINNQETDDPNQKIANFLNKYKTKSDETEKILIRIIVLVV